MSELVIREIATDYDIESLRRLRNVNTAGFSHFNAKINPAQQKQWWRSMQGRIKAWLYLVELDHAHIRTVVGYGLLRQEDDWKWWNSLAVDPRYQGQGYGNYITHDLIGKHDGPIFSSVRRDNTPALKMHHEDDWVEIDGPDMETFIYLKSRVIR